MTYFAISILRNKPKNFWKFYKTLLLFSGDITLKRDAYQMQFNDDKMWGVLKTCALHFCHFNLNNLVSKIDKLRDITNSRKPAILGITKLKLDFSIANREANIIGCSISRNDRNGNGRGFASDIRNDVRFNINNTS